MTSWLEQSSAILLAAGLALIVGVALQADPDQGGGAAPGAAPTQAPASATPSRIPVQCRDLTVR